MATRPVSHPRALLGTVVAIVAVVLIWLVTDDGSSSDEARSTAAQPSRPVTTVPRTTSVDTDPVEQTEAPRPTEPEFADGFETVHLADLPPEARDTLDLIDDGGPFPYDQDGAVFQNREGILPDRPPGYYHEYTVETPGSDDRGARRIVMGDEAEIFYTDDHYDSFRAVIR